jgi:hypothetical protein
MPAGAMREGRQSAHVSMAGQEQGSRRATARREERGTEGGARINNRGKAEARIFLSTSFKFEIHYITNTLRALQYYTGTHHEYKIYIIHTYTYIFIYIYIHIYFI